MSSCECTFAPFFWAGQTWWGRLFEDQYVGKSFYSNSVCSCFAYYSWVDIYYIDISRSSLKHIEVASDKHILANSPFLLVSFGMTGRMPSDAFLWYSKF